ncbi:MAG: bifunctional 4-hydroxy-3-methylbut-2-enyl diphosphate reductase/30S ribosomal protein S1 [Ruminococcus sp.]|nr:bifunctional 4-hydroxy-3-methylbut-2-enyl diphosphate reductase/30S ribosomal protein S1 [Ruminococcus sp.]
MLTKCKIFVAKTSGFCFGVDRAVKIVYNKLDNRNNVVTLGPIIHNRNVVADLEAKGCKAVRLEDVKQGQTAVIRSHGVGKGVYEELEKRGVHIVDATCPFVDRIHKIASEKSQSGYKILIAGDNHHPEVLGILGFCEGKPLIFADLAELKSLAKELDKNEKLCVLSQTTYNKELWEQCKEYIAENFSSAEIYDTICSATAARQKEAQELSKKADLMIIVGGKNSSNTHKLVQICKENCRTLLVENSDELKSQMASEDLSKARFIGISAGASTPAYIIKEVQQAMSEMLNNNVEEEFNFAEEMEKTLKKIHTGQKVDGVVTAINSNDEVIVDIGTKHTGYIQPNELTDDPTKKPEDVVTVGETIQMIVLKTNDQEGIVQLSKKKVDAAAGFEKIVAAKEEDAVLTGTVTNVVKGGVIVACNGVRVFIPASQSVPRGGNLENLLKKTVEFKILEVNEARQKAVGSIRLVQREAREAAKAKFFESAQVGDVVTGEVKSVTDYGAFVDLGGVDGLVRKMDLSWKRIKHPSDVISVGEKVEVKIKDIDPVNGKVSLVYKKDSENPWEIFKSSYEAGQIVKVKIVSLTSFGAFAQIIDGIDGLIHISQIANQRVDNVADMLSVGQEVDVKITEIDYEKKRISLSIRALLPSDTETDNSDESEETEQEQAEEEVVQAAEEAETADAE